MIPKEIWDKQGLEDAMDVIGYEQDGEINLYFRKAVKSIKELRGTISGGKDLAKTRATDQLDEEFGVGLTNAPAISRFPCLNRVL